jgi:hypothetical protein
MPRNILSLLIVGLLLLPGTTLAGGWDKSKGVDMTTLKGVKS